MNRLFAILPAILVATLVGACFPRPDYRALPDETVIPRSSAVVARLSVADLAAPTDGEREAVAAALAKAGDGGVRVRLHLPKAAPVPSEHVVRERVAALGVDPAIALVDATAADSVTAVEVVRFSLSPPDCSALIQPSEYDWSNSRPSMAFGCATLGNLSRMVADPADLSYSRRLGAADAATTATAIDRYRQNQVTPLRRTTSTGGSGSGGSQ